MSKSLNKNVRKTALDCLEQIEKNQAYSNLLLNNTIKKNELPAKDIGLLTELVYGTIQRKLTLDYLLKPFIKGKVESWVRNLLRLTVYQLYYLDRIPAHAAIYEAVEIAKKQGHLGIAKMVNGILRSMQRGNLPTFEQIENPIERISIETSTPLWLVERWVEQFGLEDTRKICEVNLTAPNQTARVNLTRTTREQVIKSLQEEGFSVEKSEFLPEAIHSLKGNLALSHCFKEGLITIQDESSMLVANVLQPKTNDKILDSCAAPGGKTTHIAEKLGNTGQVIALDLHEHKVKLISQTASRLQLTNVTAKVMDARNVLEHFLPDTFDRILVDAPCSGLGVLRRKPDMKYTKKEEDIFSLQKIQKELLEKIAPLLKKGGTLVYSTCTMDKEENREIIQQFLKEHGNYESNPEFIACLPESLVPYASEFDIQVMPHYFNSDGFYIAALRKKA